VLYHLTSKVLTVITEARQMWIRTACDKMEN